MHSVIYVSTAAAGFRDADLAALVTAAEQANAALKITGMLAYNGAHFMQLLEGEETTVEAILDRIAADPRHASVVVIRRGDRPGRECPDWSMRAFLTPLSGAGAATRFAADLPPAFDADTRALFTSFASAVRGVA